QTPVHGRSHLPGGLLSGGVPLEAARQGRRERNDHGSGSSRARRAPALSRSRLLFKRLDPPNLLNQQPARIRHTASHQGGTAEGSPFLAAVAQSSETSQDTTLEPGRFAEGSAPVW